MTAKNHRPHLLLWNYTGCCIQRESSAECKTDAAFEIIPFLAKRIPDLKTTKVRNQRHLIQSVMYEQPDIIAIHLGCSAIPPLDRQAYRELREHYANDKMVVAFGPQMARRYYSGYKHFDYVVKDGPEDFPKFFERTMELLMTR